MKVVTKVFSVVRRLIQTNSDQSLVHFRELIHKEVDVIEELDVRSIKVDELVKFEEGPMVHWGDVEQILAILPRCCQLRDILHAFRKWFVETNNVIDVSIGDFHHWELFHSSPPPASVLDDVEGDLSGEKVRDDFPQPWQSPTVCHEDQVEIFD